MAACLFLLAGCGETNPLVALRDLGADFKRTRQRTVELVRLPKSAGDQALSYVAELSKPEALRMLNLAGTQVTDEGLKYLEGLKGLETLDISDTNITDEGLKHLEKLSSLRDLRIGDTKVTNEGLADLVAGLPSLDVLNVAGNPKPKEPEPRTWKNALNFGIDLAGGTNLVYQVDKKAIQEKIEEAKRRGESTSELGTQITGRVMDQMVAAVSRRLNPSGVEEITVRKVGADRIEIIIPKASPEVVERKKRQMTRLGSLEFALLANQRDHQNIYNQIQKLPPGEDLLRDDGTLWASWRDVGQNANGTPKDIGQAGQIYQNEAGQYLVVFGEPDDRVTGKFLSRAYETTDENGRIAVGFLFNKQGGFRFQRLTSQNKPSADGFERRLAILLDEKIHSAPSIITTISSQGQITGQFTQEEVNELISVLNAGALTVPIEREPISEQSISPTLGVEVQRSGIMAILIAGGVVLAFMLIYYLFAGMVADLCLVLNIILVMGTMAWIDATFTLPGLAGIVLTIGMAVDANVLIFERMREELGRGSSMRLAIQNGFGRALSAIIDSNLTTLITAVVLYTVGTDQVRGFAVTLFIGIVMSMFTALYFGRMVFEICERKRWLTKLPMLSIVRSGTSWSFISKWKICAVGSVVVILVGMATFFYRGGDNFDIDFSGGTMLTFELTNEQKISNVRNVLSQEFEGETITLERLSREDLKTSSPTMGRLFRVRTKQADVKAVESRVTKAMQDANYHLISINMTQSDIKPISAEVAGQNLTPQDRALLDLYEGGHQVELTFSEGLTPERIRASFTSALASIPKAETTNAAGQTEQKYLNPEKLFRLRLSQPAVGNGEDEAASAEKRYTDVIVWTRPLLALDDMKTGLNTMRAALTEPQFEGVDSFASSVAGEMKESAVMAMLISLLATVAYLWFRFQRITFGLAAVVAVIHDVFAVLGIVAMVSYAASHWGITFLGLEDFKINLPMIAAFLTLVGYSLNDTIVVFDRIREVRGKNPALTVGMIDASLNQTLARTLLTSLTTWFVVTILYGIGGAGIHGFAFCLVAGIIVGTYSSVYVASPVLLWLMNRENKNTSRSAPAQQTQATPTAG